jgi:hypothetical protein
MFQYIVLHAISFIHRAYTRIIFSSALSRHPPGFMNVCLIYLSREVPLDEKKKLQRENLTLQNQQPLPFQPPEAVHISASFQHSFHGCLAQLPPLLRCFLFAPSFGLAASTWCDASEDLAAVMRREVDKTHVTVGYGRLTRRRRDTRFTSVVARSGLRYLAR